MLHVHSRFRLKSIIQMNDGPIKVMIANNGYRVTDKKTEDRVKKRGTKYRVQFGVSKLGTAYT